MSKNHNGNDCTQQVHDCAAAENGYKAAVVWIALSEKAAGFWVAIPVYTAGLRVTILRASSRLSGCNPRLHDKLGASMSLADPRARLREGTGLWVVIPAT